MNVASMLARRDWLLGAAALVLPGCATRAPATGSLEALVARNTAASGGAAAIEAVHGAEYAIDISEPTFKVSGVYVVDRRGRMRIDVHADGQRVYTEAFDGHAAWQMGADGKATPSAPSGAAALWHGTQLPGKLLGLHEMAAQGHHLALAPDEVLDGQAFRVIELRFSDGFETRLYLDPDTGLVARQRDVRALHPDLDPAKKQLENRFTDYRAVDGVMRSFAGSQHDAADGRWLQTSVVTALRQNVAIDDAMFAPGAMPDR